MTNLQFISLLGAFLSFSVVVLLSWRADIKRTSAFRSTLTEHLHDPKHS